MRDFVAVIMAGGSGQRFWPLSTKERPKQFLDLEHSGRSLLQATYDRLKAATGQAETVFVITGDTYAALVREQLPGLKDTLLLEPAARDTAPAIALAALEIYRRFGPVVLGVFPSDHRIGDAPAFRAALKRAARLAASSGGLVTLGVAPNRPATGYGYIERGAEVTGAYRVARFVEKPPLEQAQRYLDEGGFYWNGGIVVARADILLSELAQHVPALFERLHQAFMSGTVGQVFPSLPKQSFDYAVLEKTSLAYVVPVACDWDDLGDWEALERLLNRGQPNTVVGRHVGLDASNNIIYASSGNDMIVTLGVRDLVVVKLGDTVLLAHRERAQDIKKLLDKQLEQDASVPVSV